MPQKKALQRLLIESENKNQTYSHFVDKFTT